MLSLRHCRPNWGNMCRRERRGERGRRGWSVDQLKRESEKENLTVNDSAADRPRKFPFPHIAHPHALDDEIPVRWPLFQVSLLGVDVTKYNGRVLGADVYSTRQCRVTWFQLLRPFNRLLTGRVRFAAFVIVLIGVVTLSCLLYTSPSPRDRQKSRMPSSA